MRKTTTLLVAVLAAAFAFDALASATSTLVGRRHAAGKPVVTGYWHAGFAQVKKYAEDNGLPLVGVWSNGDRCSHCVTFETAVNKAGFVKWQQTSGIVYYFGYEGDSRAEDRTGGAGYDWCGEDKSRKIIINDYPFCRFYWKAKKGTVLKNGTVLEKDTVLVDTLTDGDTVDKRSSTKWENVRNYIQARFAQYVYDPNPAPAYLGGGFPFGTGGSGLQVEVGGAARELTIPVVRTNATAIAQAGTNYVVASIPAVGEGVGGTTVTNTVTWAAGDKVAYTKINIPALVKADVGKKIALSLLDSSDSKAVVETSEVALVAEVENSPANPRWLGERTVDTLEWGEWTMDLAVATNKTATKGGKATLILVGGSQWCPDCASVDKWLIDTDGFKAWAAGNDIACVAIDIPRMHANATTPSLLTYDAYTTSARYYTYNNSSVTNEALKATGGAGYLSRHNIPADKAAEIAERNAVLYSNATTNATARGLCRPECVGDNPKTGIFKTGVPALIVMRPNGTIAGRLYQFNNISPSSGDFTASYIARLQEMVDMIGEAAEEDNDSYLTTTETIGATQTIAGKTLSFVDQTDYYKVSAEGMGSRKTFRVNGTTDAEVTISLVNIAKGTENVVKGATATGNLDEGVEIGYTITSDLPNCYIKVSYPVDADTAYPAEYSYFAIRKATSTVCEYTLESDIVIEPQDEREPYTISNWQAEDIETHDVTFSLVGGNTYFITNVDEAHEDFEKYFIKDETVDNVYIAKLTTDAKVVMSASSFEYMNWKPGTVGFTLSSLTVSETNETAVITISRTGGTAGTAKAQVRLDKTTVKYDDIIGFEEPETFVWAEGEDFSTNIVVTILNNEYADGNQAVRFYLDESIKGNAGFGIKAMLLVINDDDKPVAGKLSLQAVEPLPAKNTTVYAREGSEVVFEVTRTGGAAGQLEYSLKAGGGAVLGAYDNVFESRNADSKPASLTMPAKGTSSKVTLTGIAGAKVNSSARYLTYTSVAANAPQFEVSAVAATAYRYVAMSNITVAIDKNYMAASGKVKISKVSGSLPSGLKMETLLDEADNEMSMVISGTPTKAGTFKAVYQAKKGNTAGLTVTVAIRVLDPVTYTPSGASSPVNGSIAKTRTISDIRVVNDEGFLDGLLTVTVPRTGKVSAKLRSMAWGTLSFSAKKWSELGEDGSLTARVVCTSSKYPDWMFDVVAKADGTIEFVDVFAEYPPIEIPAAGIAYSATNPATDFSGAYTASLRNDGPIGFMLNGAVITNDVLCLGDGYMTMTMTKASAIKTGKVTYAGLLPNGNTFSGSSTLVPTDGTWNDELQTPTWDKATLAFLTAADADSVGGVMEFDRYRAENYGNRGNRRVVFDVKAGKPQWVHIESKCADYSYAAALTPFGGKYVSTENIKEAVDKALYGSTYSAFSFFAIPNGDEFEWSTTGYDLVFSYATKTKTNSIAKQSKNAASGFSVSLSPANGVVKGKFKVDGTVMNYAAVLMPGWGTTNCENCGVVDTAARDRAMICGAAWAEGQFNYEDKLGRSKVLKTKQGCAVSVGVEAGK